MPSTTDAPLDKIEVTVRPITNADRTVAIRQSTPKHAMHGRSLGGKHKRSPAVNMRMNHAWLRKRAVNKLDHRGNEVQPSPQ